MENNQQSFWQFSDQLRVQASNLANLSLNDSIWSNNYASKRPDERRNFDIKVGGEINSLGGGNLKSKAPVSDFNDGWKQMSNTNGSLFTMPYNNLLGVGMGVDSGAGLNGGFNKGIYSKPSYANLNNNNNNNLNINLKGLKAGKGEDDVFHPPKISKKNSNNNNNKNKQGDNNNNNDNNKDAKAGADKRFKTLPPSEALPRNETIGGYIFVCNNDTMAENLKRQLFGMFILYLFLNYVLVIIIVILSMVYINMPFSYFIFCMFSDSLYL